MFKTVILRFWKKKAVAEIPVSTVRFARKVETSGLESFRRIQEYVKSTVGTFYPKNLSCSDQGQIFFAAADYLSNKGMAVQGVKSFANTQSLTVSLRVLTISH